MGRRGGLARARKHTAEELRAWGRKAGLASGVARRLKKKKSQAKVKKPLSATLKKSPRK